MSFCTSGTRWQVNPCIFAKNIHSKFVVIRSSLSMMRSFSVLLRRTIIPLRMHPIGLIEVHSVAGSSNKSLIGPQRHLIPQIKYPLHHLAQVLHPISHHLSTSFLCLRVREHLRLLALYTTCLPGHPQLPNLQLRPIFGFSRLSHWTMQALRRFKLTIPKTTPSQMMTSLLLSASGL